MARRTPINPMQKIQIKRRLQKMYQSLLNRDVIEGYEDLAIKLGIKTPTVRCAFSSSADYLSRRFVDRVIEVFGNEYSADWIYDGTGRMRIRTDIDSTQALQERWKRVAYIIEQEELSVQDFTKEIGLSHPSTIYRTLQNKTRPSNSTLQHIYERYPEYGKEWIFWGKGDPYIKPLPLPTGKSAEPYEVRETMKFPVVPDAAAAGRLTGYGDPDPEGMEYLTLPVDRYYRGNYYIFTVKGASMDNGTTESLCDGDKLLCREVARDFWSMGLHRRTWPYFVFATYSEGIIVKEVTDQDLEQDTITCHSINPNYPDIKLHLKDIIGIFNVVELVSRSMKR